MTECHPSRAILGLGSVICERYSVRSAKQPGNPIS
jgi:hypothetical protein